MSAALAADRWPGYYAADPTTGQLLQPLTGSEPYQTFVLKSRLDAKVPFVPLFAIPYLAYLLFQTYVVRDVQAGGGLGGWLVNQVWGNDQPFNGCPG